MINQEQLFWSTWAFLLLCFIASVENFHADEFVSYYDAPHPLGICDTIKISISYALFQC